ncbi:MAG: hypothetical protein HKN26_06220 [Acidimicrobiales bacterium]|nr:hypothetical protein [Acidimicrobiales bacterium]
MSAIESTNSSESHSGSTDAVPMQSARSARGRTFAVGDLDHWRRLLIDEEVRCQSTGFPAGVLSIDFGSSVAGARHNAERAQQVIDIVARHLEFTDRVCVVGPNQLGVLLIPLRNVHDAELRAIEIDDSLTEAGIIAGLGWAVRRESGLVDAWARADGNAATSHARSVHLH